MLRTVSVWLALAGLGVLNACADGGPPAAGPSWFLQHEGATAKLVYGQPNSDNVGLMLTCEAGAEQVVVHGDAEGAGAEVTLASGRATEAFDGVAYPDPMTSRTAVEARAALESPVFQRFARTGKLSLIGEGRARIMPARGADQAEVRRFFAWCDSERA